MRMLAEDELRDAVLLVFANKQVQTFSRLLLVATFLPICTYFSTKLTPLFWSSASRDAVQDLPNAMNAAEITDKLGLHSLRHRNWYIQATCATSGDGLYEGLDWLANQLKNKKWRVRSVEWGRAWVPAPGSGSSWSVVFTWRGSAEKLPAGDSMAFSPHMRLCYYFTLVNLFGSVVNVLNYLETNGVEVDLHDLHSISWIHKYHKYQDVIV